mmetsp:Transcript_34669/g.60965  ORF Transcript_34669/g.60965 Transcript_34669/m.60965 type:complete len:907 (-) Transcript_34669:49-2769(-)
MSYTLNLMAELQRRSREMYESIQDKYISLAIRYWYVGIIACLVSTAILTAGFRQLGSGTDIQLAVSPDGSKTIEDRDKFEDHYELFPGVQQFFILSKDDNIMTLNAYLELKQFDDELKEKVKSDGKNWYELCYHVMPGSPCFSPAHALLFWEGAPSIYDLSQMKTDEDIIARINGGFTYAGFPADFSAMFAEPYPEDYVRPGNTNVLQRARGVMYSLQYTGDDDDEGTIDEYELELEDFVGDFRDNAKYIEPYVFVEHAAEVAGTNVIEDNLRTIILISSILMVVLYLLLNVRFSAFHSHFTLTFGTLIICVFSFLEGIGLGGWVNSPNTSTSAAVAVFFFLFFGITHIFYIIPVFDYFIKEDPEVRVRETFRIIGAPLLCCTILHTLTFAMLSTTGMNRLRDAQSNTSIVFAFITLNYFAVVPSLMYLEALRQSKKKGDCFGGCLCAEDSIACCKGDIHYKEKDKERKPVETFYKKYILPNIKKLPVQISIVVVFLAYFAVNIAFTTQLEFDYTNEQLFYSSMEVDKCYNTIMDHFKDYGVIAFLLTDNVDISKKSAQLEYQQFIREVRECKDCEEDWTINAGDFWWYEYFSMWVAQGNCPMVEGNGVVSITSDGTIPEEDFIRCLNVWLSYDGLPINTFFEWNDDRTVLKSFFANVRMEFLDNEDVLDGMNDLRNLVEDNGPGDSLFYTPPLVTYSFFLHIENISIIHMLVLWGITFIFVTLFLQDPIQGSIVSFFTISSSLASYASIEYAESPYNPFAEFFVAVLLPVTSDFFIYYFAYINHATGKPKSRLKFASTKIAYPTIAKFFVMIGGTIGLACSRKVSEHAGMFFAHIAINTYAILFLVPVLCCYLYPSLPSQASTRKKYSDGGSEAIQLETKQPTDKGEPETATMEGKLMKLDIEVS